MGGIIRFEPLPGRESAFREELLRVNKPTRAETGCLRIDVFESLQEPFVFAVRSAGRNPGRPVTGER